MSWLNKHRVFLQGNRRLELEQLEGRYAVSTFLFAALPLEIESIFVGSKLPDSDVLNLDAEKLGVPGTRHAKRDGEDTHGKNLLRLTEHSLPLDRLPGRGDPVRSVSDEYRADQASDAVFANEGRLLDVGQAPFHGNVGLAAGLGRALPTIDIGSPDASGGVHDESPSGKSPSRDSFTADHGSSPTTLSATGRGASAASWWGGSSSSGTTGGGGGGSGGSAGAASSAQGHSSSAQAVAAVTTPPTKAPVAGGNLAASTPEPSAASAVVATSPASAVIDSPSMLPPAPAGGSSADTPMGTSDVSLPVSPSTSQSNESPASPAIDVMADVADAQTAGSITVAAQVATQNTQYVVTASEVQQLLRRAAAASSSEDAIIAVVDRAGQILGVRVESGVGASDLVFKVDGAVAKARTAAFFASDQAPLTSRTVQLISQTTITEREVLSNPNIPDLDSTLRGPGFVAPIGLGGHFPPGVSFTPHANLFAIEHTNRDSIVHPGSNRVKEPVNLNGDGTVNTPTGDDIFLETRFGADFATFAADESVAAPESYGFVSGTNTAAQARGIATLPGGIPLFKNGEMVGGIGVFFPGPDGFADFEQNFVPGIGQTSASRVNAPRVLEAEYIAFTTADSVSIGGIPPLPGFQLPRGRLDLDGIKLEVYGPHPFGEDTLRAVGDRVGFGDPDSGMDMPVNTQSDLYLDGKRVPEGWLVLPKNSTDGGLTADQVREIIQQGVAEANRVRAGIRLPLGSRTRMVLSVADTNGELLGLFRMPDATYFSIDVAVAKARNVSYYADPSAIQDIDRVDGNQDGVPDLDPGVAFTNRTFRFLSEPFFPSGIDGTGGGAFSILRDPGVDPSTAENTGAPVPASAHTSVLGFDAFNPGSNFHEPVPGTGFQNGVVFFPGSTPLYENGILVGGLGVSGDGVDQDDVVSFSGSGPFRPSRGSPVVRADQVFVDGVRLPYQKFLRNPRG